MRINSYLKKILVLAILLRILVSGLLFHPDIKTIAFQTSFLKKGVNDIYTYLIQNKVSLPLKEEFVYFPLTYFTLGGYETVASKLLGDGLDNWLANADSNSISNDPNIFKYLIVLKFPLLITDLLIAFVILNYFKDQKKSENAFTLWLFNPFTIILIYAFSNIDIYAVLLTMLSFLYIKRNSIVKSAVFLGLAISFKLYPLLFLPFIFLKAKDLKEKLIAVCVPLAIFFVSVIPFWSINFVQSALVTGLSTRIFSPSFSVGFGESIILGLFLLSVLFVYAWMFKGSKNTGDINLLNYFTAFLLIIFSFSHFHISWLLWIAPFLVILVIKKPEFTWPVLLWSILAISIPMLYSDRSMTLSLFRVYTNWFDLLPTPFTVVQKFYDPLGMQSIIHSALAGLSVVMFAKLFREEQKSI